MDRPADRNRSLIRSEQQWENEGGSLIRTSRQQGSESSQPRPLSAGAIELLEVLPHGILITARDGTIVYCNQAYEQLSGQARVNILGEHWLQTLAPEDRRALTADPDHKDDQRTIEARLAHSSPKGTWTRQTITSLASGRHGDGHIHMIEDISAARAVQANAALTNAQLARECERARVTLECIGDAVISTDASGRISYMNRVAEQLTGWSRELAHDQPFSTVFRIVDTDSRQSVDSPAQSAINADGIVRLAANCSLLRADGSELEIEDSAAPILNEAGEATGAVVVFRDRQYSRTTSNRMSYLARHDALTGLANRVALIEQFDHALNLARRHDGQLAVLFIDLNHFKTINDLYGHTAGDRLLSRVARTLARCVRETDTVCRYGGDEFVVLLSEIDQADDAERVAGKLQQAVRQRLTGSRFNDVTLSIGISLYPIHAIDSESLLRKADAAMYLAKAQPGATHCLYQSGLPGFAAPSDRQNQASVAQRTDRKARNGR
jgi:diguanylate cyclase (GGDEF)-like protein/PAS domain S-box-containing protein